MTTIRKLKSVGKPAAKSAPVKALPKAPVSTKPAAKRMTSALKHEVTSLYVAGPSKGFNERKSLTALPIAEFGSKPDYMLTMRTENVGETLKRKYRDNPFPIANADRGVLKFLGWKGHIEVVSGDGRDPGTMVRFTKAGMSARYSVAA